jgi:hypothetical protein
MILRELFDFDKEPSKEDNEKRYSPSNDDSIVKFDDTRKSRLTLRQINRIRKANELSNKERSQELEQVRQMYGTAANADGGAIA